MGGVAPYLEADRQVPRAAHDPQKARERPVGNVKLPGPTDTTTMNESITPDEKH
jgi:hypothetical protein